MICRSWTGSECALKDLSSMSSLKKNGNYLAFQWLKQLWHFTPKHLFRDPTRVVTRPAWCLQRGWQVGRRGLAGRPRQLTPHCWSSKPACSVPGEELRFGRASENVNVILVWNSSCLLHFNDSKFWQVSERGKEFCSVILALAEANPHF